MGNFLGRLALLVLATHSFSAFSAPLAVKQHDGIVYFADDTSTAIARYSMVDESPLTPLTLAQAPQALLVNEEGILASYGKRVVHLDLAGGGETEFRVTSTPIIEMASNDKFIFLGSTDSIQVLAKSTGAFLGSQSISELSSPIVVDDVSNHVFMSNTAWSPSDIYRLAFSDSGVLKGAIDSPYHGDYATGNKVFVNAAKNWVADSSGNIYNTDDLTHLGDLGGAFDDLAFWKNLPVLLRGNKLQGYNNGRQLVGEAELTLANPIAVMAYNNTLVVFNALAEVEMVTVAALNLIGADGPVNPATTPFTFKKSLLGPDNDTIYLVANEFNTIFRWSLSTQKYLPNIELTGPVFDVSLDDVNNKLYISYKTGRVTIMDLAVTGAPQEKLFIQLDFNLASIVATPKWIAALNQDTFQLQIFDKNTKGLVSDKNFSQGNQINWSEAKQSLVFYSAPFVVVYPFAGTDDYAVTTNNVIYFDSRYVHKLRLSENDSFIAVSSGFVTNIKGQKNVAQLDPSQAYIDIAWLHGNVFTLFSIDDGIYGQINRWLPDYSKDATASQEIKGTPLALVPIAAKNTLLVVFGVEGLVQFKAFNYVAGDFDQDGYLDSIDEMPADASDWQDYDADGVGNSADTDDDNDGVDDLLDAFPFDINESQDTDSDGIGNVADDDDDNDGVKDDDDRFPLDASETLDVDFDGVGDNADPDDDNDGINDVDDVFPLDRSEWLDTDGDGIGNNQDDDDDNDGVLDNDDALPLNANESLDTDFDGIGNNQDDDDDGDGVKDNLDAFPLNPWESLDTDGDSIGNTQDEDDDNDGVVDLIDLFPLDAAEAVDTDGDGIGNNADLDDDNDGVLDINDAFPLYANESLDSDHDGIGDNQDPDDDNDGLYDVYDFYPLDPLLKMPDLSTYFPSKTGGQWRFIVNNSASVTAKIVTAKTIAGQQILPLEFDGGIKIYVKTTSNKINFYGVYLHKVVTNIGNYSVDIQLPSGINLLTQNFITGADLGTGTVDIQPKYGKRTLEWSAQINYAGLEKITIPSGSYNAMHTVMDLYASANIDGSTFSVIYSAHYWFVENIGIVQMLDTSGEFKLQSFTAGTGEPVEVGDSSGAAAGKSGGGGSLSLYGLLSLLLLVFIRRRLFH